MTSSNRFGFLSSSGLNQFIDQNGVGFHFEIIKEDLHYNRFFPNVGQPNQNPPIHPSHKDNLSYWDDITLLEANFKPFYAEYVLLGTNKFKWWEFDNNKVLFEAELEDSCIFYPLGEDIAKSIRGTCINSKVWISGIDFEVSINGKVRAVIDFDANKIHMLPKQAPQMTAALRPELHPAQVGVFYNLTKTNKFDSGYYIPVNKTWPRVIAEAFSKPKAIEGPLQFAWDSAFSSIILTHFDIELAKSNFSILLGQIQDDGRIPQISLGDYISNRTNPPVWFLAAQDIFNSTKDIKWLAQVFPHLLDNYRWFKKNRMNDNSTFSWGTDNEDDDSLLKITGAIGAAYESGLDDSPVFSEMSLEGTLLNYACIDLSSLIYNANEILLSFAIALKNKTKIISKETLNELKEDKKLFSEAIHLFFDLENKKVNSFKIEAPQKLFCNTLTPQIFYTLLSSALNSKEVKLLKELFYSDSFSSTQILPSLDYKNKNFNGDGDYWRGRIWPPLVYITALGFKKWDKAIYKQIKEAALSLLNNEWERHHHIHENYSSITGHGEPSEGIYARSCPLYSWGGLLGVV